MRCTRYNLGDILPRYIEKDGGMVRCLSKNFELLGILVRFDATPTAGKNITQSHGELIAGAWTEIIDEEKTPAEIAAAEALAVNNFSKIDVRRAMRTLGIENHLDALLASNETFKKDWDDSPELDLLDEISQQAVMSYNEATNNALDINAIKLKIAEA